MAKDFDRIEGKRFRIAFTRYNSRRRYFEHVKGAAILVTVADADEQRRLIGAIENLVSERTWTNERASSAPDPVASASVPV